MHRLIVTAVGEDRPGIVAAVTEAFFKLGCNLADCSMTRLSSQFAMILLVEAPGVAAGESLREALKEPAGNLGLTVSVVEAPATSAGKTQSGHIVSLYGSDRPGIVYRVSRALADLAVNITDLTSHPVGQGVYTVLLEVDIPGSLAVQEVEKALKEVAAELGVDFALRPCDPVEL